MTAVPTGAEDGTTPLNAANVQWKAGNDSRSGNLVFTGCKPQIANQTIVVPLNLKSTADLITTHVPPCYFLMVFPLEFYGTAPTYHFTPNTVSASCGGPYYQENWTTDYKKKSVLFHITHLYNYMELTLNAGIDSSATGLIYLDGAEAYVWPSSGYAIVGTEQIQYDNFVDVGGGIKSLNILARGAHGTEAAAHSINRRIWPCGDDIAWKGTVEITVS